MDPSIGISDTIPPSTEEFQATIETITKELAPIAEKQEKIALSLHCRSEDALEKIQERYTALTRDLQELSSTIANCQILIKQQSEQLPIVEDRITWKDGWQQVADLEPKGYRLKERDKTLTLLLNSSEHRNALLLYREVLQTCKKDRKSILQLVEPAQQKIAAQQEAIKHFNPALKEAISLLHDEILRLLQYITGIKKERALEEPVPVFKLGLNEQNYFSSFQYVALKPDRSFKSDVSLQAYWYKNIYSIIPLMQGAAKGLQKIEFDLELDIERAWKAPFLTSMKTHKIELYGNCLKKIKENINNSKESLYTINFPQEVFEGLSYAASLCIWANEIESSLAFFDKITQNSWKSVAAAQDCVYKNLQLKNPAKDSSTYNSLESISTFHHTVRLLKSASCLFSDPSLEEDRNRILSRALHSLNRIGNALFPLSSYEEELEISVITGASLMATLEKSSLNENIVSGIQHGIVSLVEKKFVRYTYYNTEKTRFDLSLDLFLTAFSAQEACKKLFSKKAEPSQSPPFLLEEADLEEFTSKIKEVSFDEIFTTYSKQTSLAEDKLLLSQLNEIQRLLKGIEYAQKKSRTPLYIFSLYTRVQQKLFEARNKIKAPLSQERLNAFLLANEKKLSDIKTAYQFPSYCDRLDTIIFFNNFLASRNLSQLEPAVYKLLLQALWAENKGERRAAKNLIAQLITENSACNFFSHQIIYLLKELAVNAFSFSKPNSSQITKTYLPRFLAKYIENPDNYSEYRPEIIERILYTVLVKESEDMKKHPDLQAALAKHRNGLFFEDWKKIMTHYINATNSQQKTSCKIQFSFFQSAHVKELTSNDYYSNVYTSCFKELETN